MRRLHHQPRLNTLGGSRDRSVNCSEGPMSQIATRFAGALGLLLLAGCSSDRATAPRLFPETITVSSGLSPQISWSPGGAVYSITVTRVGSTEILWVALGELHRNAINPSVG